MKFVIELLNRHLVDETEHRADCIEFLDGGVVSPMSDSERETRKAFIVSKQIAEERIPQLVEAIKILTDGNNETNS